MGMMLKLFNASLTQNRFFIESVNQIVDNVILMVLVNIVKVQLNISLLGKENVNYVKLKTANIVSNIIDMIIVKFQ